MGQKKISEKSGKRSVCPHVSPCFSVPMFQTLISNVKLKRQSRLAIDWSRHENLTNCIGKFDSDREPVIVEARIEIDFREAKDVLKNRFQGAFATHDAD